MKKEAPCRKVFWFIYLGLALALYSQKEARGLAMEFRPNSEIQPFSGSDDQVITPSTEVYVTWQKRPGDKPTHYEFESSVNCTTWQALPFDSDNVQVEGDRYSLWVGSRNSLGPRFFVRSVYDEE